MAPLVLRRIESIATAKLASGLGPEADLLNGAQDLYKRCFSSARSRHFSPILDGTLCPKGGCYHPAHKKMTQAQSCCFTALLWGSERSKCGGRREGLLGRCTPLQVMAGSLGGGKVGKGGLGSGFRPCSGWQKAASWCLLSRVFQAFDTQQGPENALGGHLRGYI